MNQRAQTLNRLRRQIDRIDQSLLHLLNRRASAALRIGTLKKQQGLPIFDAKREGNVLRRMIHTNSGPLSETAVREIFRRILRENRWLQKENVRARGKPC